LCCGPNTHFENEMTRIIIGRKRAVPRCRVRSSVHSLRSSLRRSTLHFGTDLVVAAYGTVPENSYVAFEPKQFCFLVEDLKIAPQIFDDRIFGTSFKLVRSI
jgi:hypothetical protein